MTLIKSPAIIVPMKTVLNFLPLGYSLIKQVLLLFSKLLNLFPQKVFLHANPFHYTDLFIPVENVRKPLTFWCFQGVKKETNTMKLVEGTSIKCVPWVLDDVPDILDPRSRQKSEKSWNKVNLENFKDIESICNCIHNYITHDIKNVFHQI